MRYFFKTFYSIVNVIIIILLLIIHFVIKDCNYEMSLLFYAFPLPIIITIVLLLSICLSKKMRKINIVVALLLLMVWLGRSFQINSSEDTKETDIEVVLWNAGHHLTLEDAFSVNKSIPDVLVLVEYDGKEIHDIKKKYPHYSFHELQREIAIFSKEKINIINESALKVSSTVIHFETYGVNFYATDLPASIDVPRDWGIDLIESSIKSNKNAVLLGDFNVPYESILLDTIKESFNHALTEKGNGFRETWFWNLPILSLDHIWVSKDLELVKAEKINTWKSDHSMVKVFIRN